MINFPVAGGTSGHLIGAVLAAVLLGPSAAVIVISAVLIVQCLMFADGGISALGANIFNMGVHRRGRRVGDLPRGQPRGQRAVRTRAGGRVRRLVQHGPGLHRLRRGAGGLSHRSAGRWPCPPWRASTCSSASAKGSSRPWCWWPSPAPARSCSQPDSAAEPRRSYGAVVAYGGLIALGLALFVSPFASRWPDGLDRTAEVLGFKEKAVGPDGSGADAGLRDARVPLEHPRHVPRRRRRARSSCSPSRGCWLARWCPTGRSASPRGVP